MVSLALVPPLMATGERGVIPTCKKRGTKKRDAGIQTGLGSGTGTGGSSVGRSDVEDVLQRLAQPCCRMRGIAQRSPFL
jgi:hypothetical protein